MGKKKLSTKQKWLNFLKKGLPIIVGLILAMVTTFGVTMAYFGQSSGPLSTDITLKTGVKIGSTSSIAGSTDKVVPSQPVTISATAMVEPADNKTTTITDAILRAKVRTTTEEDINLQISTTAVTVGTKTGYWVEHTDGYFYLCAETKNATVGNTKLLVFNPGTEGVSVLMSGTFTVPNTITNEMGGEPLNVIATFEVAQGELYTSGSTTRIPDASMTIANEIVQEVFGSLVTTYEVGDIITFGEYPQSLKAADIPNPTQVVDATGFNGQPIYADSDGNRYVKQKMWDYSSNNDITTYNMNVSMDGRVMTKNTEYYFKFEPIEWKVISVENGVAQVLATKALDGLAYQSNYMFYNGNHYITDGTANPTEVNILRDDKTGEMVYANNYKYSELRSFLNGVFYNVSFSSSDKGRIMTTIVDNSVDTTFGEEGIENYCCENTSDKVYALSYADVHNTEYGFMAEDQTSLGLDINRVHKITDFAIARGADKVTFEFLFGDDAGKADTIQMLISEGYSEEFANLYADHAVGSASYSSLRSPSLIYGQSHRIMGVEGVSNSDVKIIRGVVPALQLMV